MSESAHERAFALALRALAPELHAAATRELVFAPPRRWRFDFAFERERVAVEVDGGQWVPGGGRHNTDKDREKLNEAGALGWRVLRFSGEQVQSNPSACLDVLRAALAWGRAGPGPEG